MKIEIVIVGVGKMGKIHYESYQRIKKTSLKVIALIDPMVELIDFSKGIFNPKIHKNIKSFKKDYKSKESILIFDICTPNVLHLETFKQLHRLFPNAYFFIEKPACKDTKSLQQIYNATPRVLVCENYLYSRLSSFVKKIIRDYGVIPLSVKTDFSKNRIRDTLNYRGAIDDKNLQNIFEIEVPHQIAIAVDLLGPISEYNITNYEDMVFQNNVIPNMGSCKFSMVHNSGVSSIHYSSLESNRLRNVNIACDNNMLLKLKYSEDNSFLSSIRILNNDKQIAKFTIRDDSVTRMLNTFITFIIVNQGLFLDCPFTKTNKLAAQQVVNFLEFSNEFLDKLE